MLQYYYIETYVMSKQFIRPNVYEWRSDCDALAARLEAMIDVGACGHIGDER